MATPITLVGRFSPLGPLGAANLRKLQIIQKDILLEHRRLGIIKNSNTIPTSSLGYIPVNRTGDLFCCISIRI